MSCKNTNSNFIKVDNNTLINENYVQWMKKVDECIYICNKVYGCQEETCYGAHKVCKVNNIDNYNELVKKFNK
jgi:hypothetical protein